MAAEKRWECPICHGKRYYSIVIRIGFRTESYPAGTSRDEHDLNMCNDCGVLFVNPEKFCAPQREGGIKG